MPVWRPFYKKLLGLQHPHWDDRAPAFKGSAVSSLHVTKLIYSENTDPLQPRGHRKVCAAPGGSVCHDLAFPETLGKLSETASDQVADYKTDWLCMDTRYIWRSTSGLMGLVLCMNLSCFFKWSLIQLPPNLQHAKPQAARSVHQVEVSHDPRLPEDAFQKLLKTQTRSLSTFISLKNTKEIHKISKTRLSSLDISHIWDVSPTKANVSESVGHPNPGRCDETILQSYTLLLPPTSFIIDVIYYTGECIIY